MCENRPNVPQEYRDLSLDEVPVHPGLARRLGRMGFRTLGDLNRINAQDPGRGWSDLHKRALHDLLAGVQLGMLAPPPELSLEESIVRLAERIDAGLAGVSPVDLEILERRMGADAGPRMTLEQLARQLGCTREYVRQIEEKILTRVRSTPGPSFTQAAKLLAATCARTGTFISPLQISQLLSSGGRTPLRSGRFYAALLSILFPELPVWIRLTGAQQRRSGPEKAIRMRLDEILDARDGEVPLTVGYVGVLAFLRDATPTAFRDAVMDDSRYEVVGEATAEWAIRRTRRMPGKVGAVRVLELSDGPLTAAEINERGRREFPGTWGDLGDRSLGNYLATDHAAVFLLARGGRFGLARHIGLSDKQRHDLADQFHGAVREAARPMTTTEFVRRHGSETGGADAYVLAAIADMDGRFVRVGRRLMFGVRTETLPTPPVRVPPLREAAVAVLREAGRPLTAAEIGELIRRHRSCSEHALSPTLNRLQRAGTIAGTVDRKYTLAVPVPAVVAPMANPYSPSSGYHRIFQRLAAAPPVTEAELVAFAMRELGKSSSAADSSVWVVISPREGGRNPRGNGASKGHLYYVTNDADGKLHVHPRIPPMEPYRRERRRNG